MKPRGLVILPVVAAVLSTMAIVASAQGGAKPRRAVPVMSLRQFDLRFNKMMNNAIRKTLSGRTSAMANLSIAEKCFNAFVDDSAQALPKNPKPICKLERAEQQQLRDLVNRWLDDIYIGKVPDDQLKALKPNRDGDFFSEKIHP